MAEGGCHTHPLGCPDEDTFEDCCSIVPHEEPWVADGTCDGEPIPCHLCCPNCRCSKGGE